MTSEEAVDKITDLESKNQKLTDRMEEQHEAMNKQKFSFFAYFGMLVAIIAGKTVQETQDSGSVLWKRTAIALFLAILMLAGVGVGVLLQSAFTGLMLVGLVALISFAYLAAHFWKKGEKGKFAVQVVLAFLLAAGMVTGILLM
jgi:hypothetical protein